jgi:hypothetical protein
MNRRLLNRPLVIEEERINFDDDEEIPDTIETAVLYNQQEQKKEKEKEKEEKEQPAETGEGQAQKDKEKNTDEEG